MSNLYGVRITKDGFSAVDPNVNPKDVAFDSSLEHFQFQTTGKESYASDTLKTINHNLGYEPGFMAFIKESGDNFWHSIFRNVGDHEAYVDNSNLYLYGQNGDDIRYYLFQKPLDPTANTARIRQSGYGILSVTPGADVNKPRYNEINFSSKWGSLIIYKEIELSVTVSTQGTQQNSVAHGMGYAPAWVASVTDGIDFYTEPYVYADASDLVFLAVLVDDTNVTVEASVSSSFVPLTATFTIFLLTEELD